MVTVLALVTMNVHSAVARDTVEDDTPLIASINSQPGGQSYGRWAVEWWQWALGVPAIVNPLTDTTGDHCRQRQVDSVWFLAGSTSDKPVVRACDIPAGKSLFFPLITSLYGAFLNDPPETQTEAFVRQAASCTVPVHISVSIDRHRVEKPRQFFTGASGSQSPIFNVQMAPGNLIGNETVVPHLVLTPSAEQGYYLFVRPLSAGSHTIQWTASGCSPGFSQDITYNLTVAGGDRND
jgi:hypothetical protein